MNLTDEELKEYGIEPEPGAEPVCVPPESVVKVDLNQTFSGEAHVHDYWNGQEEVIIFEDDVVFLHPSSPMLHGLPYGQGLGYFNTPGALAYPGARTVVFTVTWDAVYPGELRRLNFDMPGDDARAPNFISRVFATSGESWEIPINLSNNDPPHLNTTLWDLNIVDSQTNNKAQAHLTWAIRRGYDCLPIDPPHYDQWAGLNNVTLLDAAKSGTMRKTPAASSQLEPPPIVNRTVPPETKSLRVTMTWTEAQTNSKLGLQYCAPNGFCDTYDPRWRTASSFTEVAPNKRTFEMEVLPEEWDSPYDRATDWRFRPTFDNGSASIVLGGYGNFEGSIHWLIEALR